MSDRKSKITTRVTYLCIKLINEFPDMLKYKLQRRMYSASGAVRSKNNEKHQQTENEGLHLLPVRIPRKTPVRDLVSHEILYRAPYARVYEN
jgi:hypothetical protein